MYTNGLKDRFGSPLISKRELDEALGALSLSLSEEEKAALQQLVQGSLVSKDELGEVLGALSLSLSLSAEEKEALQQLVNKGSIVSTEELSEVLGALSLSLSLSAEEKAALQQLVQGSLTVKEITIVDDDANAVSLLSENYEEIEDEGIVLNFEDSLDNTYLTCSEEDLVDATDYLELDVNINCPEELGKKLVRRYLVIDLRNMEDSRNIVTIFPENIRWSSEMPVIEANKFYVISFQRFAKDLVVANLEINLAE